MRYLIYFLMLLLLGCATSQNFPKDMGNKNKVRIKKQKIIHNQPKKNLWVPPPVIEAKRPSNYPNLSTPVSLTLKDASLKEVILSLAKQAGVNIVFDEDVEDSKVSVNLTNVPLSHALRAILTAHDLYFKPYPYYIRISRMCTKFFHIDYIVSVREGKSNTNISLSSGSGGGTSEGSSSVLKQSSNSGNISIASSEVINFWENFEKDLKEILKDPLYNVLQSEYNRKVLKQQIDLLPYQTQYQKEIQKQQLEMLSIHKEILKKELAEGNVPNFSTFSTTQGQTTTSTSSTTNGNTGGTSETTNQLIGTYTINPQTGTVVVTTTPELMKKVEEFISKVKENLSLQVLIDVQIFEVTLNRGHEVGIDWSKFPGLLEIYKMPQLRQIINTQMTSQATQSSSGGSTSTSGQGVTSPLATSPFPSVPGGNLQVGILHSLTSTVAYQWNIDSLISFLKTQGTVKAISRPQLMTLNNQPAIVSVGTNDFYITYEQTTTSAQAGLATSSVTSKLNPLFVGITLNVTPQISSSGEIILKIVPTINKKVGEKSVPTGIPSAPLQNIPIMETRETSTIVKAQDGQPIIISGLIQETTNKTTNKVPVLGDLPILGHIFSYNSDSKNYSELVMVIVPHLTGKKDLKSLGYKNIQTNIK
ncbi:secretin N-terminal domain-containing protein [Desulfothermus sp.]